MVKWSSDFQGLAQSPKAQASPKSHTLLTAFEGLLPLFKEWVLSSVRADSLSNLSPVSSHLTIPLLLTYIPPTAASTLSPEETLHKNDGDKLEPPCPELPPPVGAPLSLAFFLCPNKS